MTGGLNLHNFAARMIALIAFSLVAIIATGQVGAQIVQPDLLTAANFSVLAGQTVTNIGPTILGQSTNPPLGGDLGVSPGSAIEGFPPGSVIAPGVIHQANAVALQAQSDLVTAYNVLAGQTPCTALPASIGTLTLTAGVYCFTSAALLTMPSLGLTLDLQGDQDALFIFQIPDQLTTQTGYPVTFVNGTVGCNVWWQVGSSATLGTGTQFAGNIVALTSISLGTGTTILPGRALARNGEVTMNTNIINRDGCLTEVPTSTPTETFTPTDTFTPTFTATFTATPFTPSSDTVTTPTPDGMTNAMTGTPSGMGSVTSLPSTGERADNRLPLLLFGGLLLLVTGVWMFGRTPKLR